MNSTSQISCMGKFLTPEIGLNQSYNVNFNNMIYHPHEGHTGGEGVGGVISSTGFFLTYRTPLILKMMRSVENTFLMMMVKVILDFIIFLD